MGDVINLRQVRKARKRVAGERQAEANRAKHGRSKAEKRLAETERQRQDAALDAARRDRTED
jgi:hypothetical protein